VTKTASASATFLLGVLLSLVLPGALFLACPGTAVEELAGEYDCVCRLRDRLPEGRLVLYLRLVGAALVVLGVVLVFTLVRPSSVYAARLWSAFYLVLLVLVGAGGVAMLLRPRAFIIGMNPTLELLDRHTSNTWTDRIIRGFGVLVLLSSVLLIYFAYLRP